MPIELFPTDDAAERAAEKGLRDRGNAWSECNLAGRGFRRNHADSNNRLVPLIKGDTSITQCGEAGIGGFMAQSRPAR